MGFVVELSKPEKHCTSKIKHNVCLSVNNYLSRNLIYRKPIQNRHPRKSTVIVVKLVLPQFNIEVNHSPTIVVELDEHKHNALKFLNKSSK